MSDAYEMQLRQDVLEDVRKLYGVRSIVNNITLRPIVETQDVKKKIEDALRRHAEIEAQDIRVVGRKSWQTKLGRLQRRAA